MENPLNKKLISLIIISAIPDNEKRIWMDVLPDMTEEEKNELVANLEEQVKYEKEMSEKAINQFVEALNKVKVD